MIEPPPKYESIPILDATELSSATEILEIDSVEVSTASGPEQPSAAVIDPQALLVPELDSTALPLGFVHPACHAMATHATHHDYSANHSSGGRGVSRPEPATFATGATRLASRGYEMRLGRPRDRSWPSQSLEARRAVS